MHGFFRGKRLIVFMFVLILSLSILITPAYGTGPLKTSPQHQELSILETQSPGVSRLSLAGKTPSQDEFSLHATAVTSIPITDAAEKAGNRIVPEILPVAGMNISFEFVGYNLEALFQDLPPQTGSVAYVPYTAVEKDNGKTYTFLDEAGNYQRAILEGTIPKPGNYTFTVNYDKYVFNGAGWFMEGDGSVCWAQDLTLVVFGTVIQDANGGTPTRTDFVKTGSKFKGLKPDPTRAGYKFDGWYTAKVGGTKLTASTTISLPDSQAKIVYAHWTKDVKVSFVLNSGKLTAAQKKKFSASYKVKYSRKYGSLPAPSRAGYTLRGWYMSNAVKGTKVTAASTVTKTKAHKLYAQWLYKGSGKTVTKKEFDNMKTGYSYEDCKKVIGGAAIKTGTWNSGSKFGQYKDYPAAVYSASTGNAVIIFFHPDSYTLVKKYWNVT